MIRRFLFAALAASYSLAAGAGSLPMAKPESVGMSSERLQRVTEYYQGRIDEGHSAGMQILVARKGKVVLHESLGELELGSGRNVDDQSLFRIYSMTKPITATALMILYEEGHFSLNDPVAKYVPEFAELRVFAGVDESGEMILQDANRPPSIHDLLQHTAGFTYGIFGDTPVDLMYRDGDLLNPEKTLKEMIDGMAKIPLLYQPGEDYVYSMASDVQGYLIEVLSGMPADQFIRERIFEPLEMDETLTWVPANRANRLAAVHTHGDDGLLKVYESDSDPDPVQFALQEPIRFSGGGQLISTADDYFLFSQMLLNGGQLNGKRIISAATVRMMTSNRYPESIQDRLYDAGRGHGFNLKVVTDYTLVGFPASNGEFSHGGLATTHFWVDPVEELVVVLIDQYFPTSNEAMRDAAHRLVHAAIID